MFVGGSKMHINSKRNFPEFSWSIYSYRRTHRNLYLFLSDLELSLQAKLGLFECSLATLTLVK